MLSFYKCLTRHKYISSLLKYSTNVNLKELFDISSPPVQKYLEHLRINYVNGGETPGNLIPVIRKLEERFMILENIKTLEELQKQDTGGEMKELARSERESYENALKEIDSKISESLFPERFIFPHSECIVEVMHGVGGQEAMLFAKELMQMYIGYASYRGWNVDMTGEDVTETGGMRHGSFVVSGTGAYEIMRCEAGVHRVQRVPATEKSGRLHTSTVRVSVMLQPDEIEIKIPDCDIKIERKRSSGAGGQSVNTTDSCVRIFHLPTGLIVECQQERDQHKNKSKAMARLRALLYQRKLDVQVQKDRDEKRSQIGSGLRNEKIRTYNFNQDRVTDHRLGSSTGTIHDLNGVLQGGPNLDTLINRIMQHEHRRKIIDEIEALNSNDS